MRILGFGYIMSEWIKIERRKNSQEKTENATTIIDKIKKIEDNLMGQDSVDRLIRHLINLDCHEIICLGIGRFDNHKSLEQLTLLKVMKRKTCICRIYDPVMRPIDIEICEKLGLDIIKENHVRIFILICRRVKLWLWKEHCFICHIVH
jgi:hypothetical protein